MGDGSPKSTVSNFLTPPLRTKRLVSLIIAATLSLEVKLLDEYKKIL